MFGVVLFVSHASLLISSAVIPHPSRCHYQLSKTRKTMEAACHGFLPRGLSLCLRAGPFLPHPVRASGLMLTQSYRPVAFPGKPAT
jgi:hypothetical protein